MKYNKNIYFLKILFANLEYRINISTYLFNHQRFEIKL